MITATTILVREPKFEHERGAGGLSNPRLPELSHTLNGFQLALPYLEPGYQPSQDSEPAAFAARQRDNASAGVPPAPLS
jgi:hypothetical protein